MQLADRDITMEECLRRVDSDGNGARAMVSSEPDGRDAAIGGSLPRGTGRSGTSGRSSCSFRRTTARKTAGRQDCESYAAGRDRRNTRMKDGVQSGWTAGEAGLRELCSRPQSEEYPHRSAETARAEVDVVSAAWQTLANTTALAATAASIACRAANLTTLHGISGIDCLSTRRRRPWQRYTTSAQGRR